jgi:hypothetical protein
MFYTRTVDIELHFWSVRDTDSAGDSGYRDFLYLHTVYLIILFKTSGG